MEQITLNFNAARNQRAQIREALLEGRRITDDIAREEFGCRRLGARIWELRHDEGLKVEKELILCSNGNRVARYYIQLTN
jgi:hypothetical protein